MVRFLRLVPQGYSGYAIGVLTLTSAIGTGTTSGTSTYFGAVGFGLLEQLLRRAQRLVRHFIQMFGKLQVPAEPFERPNPDQSLPNHCTACVLRVQGGFESTTGAATPVSILDLTQTSDA